MIVTFFFAALVLFFAKGAVHSTIISLKFREHGTSDLKYITMGDKKIKKASLFKWVVFNYVSLVCALLLLLMRVLKVDFGFEISSGLYLTGISIMFFTVLRNIKNKNRFDKTVYS